MSERFKFRAWDKWKKTMIQPNDGDFIGWHAMSNWRDCLEVMQCTGATDKHDKDVYEGDLVRVYMSGRPVGVDQIVYAGHGFYMADLDEDLKKIGGLTGVWFYDFEVIGNIYENPELIK